MHGESKITRTVYTKTGFNVNAETVSDALAFVMGKLDKVGEHPMITIFPQYCEHEDESHWFFEVTVEGTDDHEETVEGFETLEG